MKRAFIIHGWTTTNEQDWIPWAAREMTKKGYKTFAPLMPNTDHPVIDVWIKKMKDTVGDVQPNDVFIGHSLGCQAILRFLEIQPRDAKVDMILLVAGAQHLSEEAVPLPEDEAIFGPWRDTPINFKKIKRMANQIVALFSDDDPWVLFKDNAPIYQQELGATIILEKNKGHFMKDLGGVTELPIILDYFT